MYKLLISGFFFSMICSFCFAQNGRIAGKVFDGKTNETLPGATVVIQGTTTGVSADMDGQYILPNIAPGTYILEIKVISYATKVVKEVVVVAGKTTSVNISLEPATTDLKEFVVEATMNRESQNVMLLMQKNNSSVSDGIAAEQIRRSPDRSTAEVLKRVSGVSIQDNKFAVVRGLSDRYNMALVNGAILPSTEAERRTFSFDMFPSFLIDNISINKTATPDMPGEFSGGIIQINTKDVPDDPFFSFSAGAGYNTLSTFKPYEIGQGGKTDWLGWDDGTRALPSGFPDADEFSKMSKSDKVRMSQLFPNDWSLQQRSSAPLNGSYQLALARSARLAGNPLGIVFALTYNSSNRYNLINRRDFNEDTTSIYNYDDAQYRQNVLWGSLLNVSYRLGNNHRIRVQNIVNVSAENQTIRREGINYELEQLIRNSAIQYQNSVLVISQLSGEHVLSKKGAKARWDIGHTAITRHVPDLRKMYYTKNVIPNDESDTVYQAYIQGVASPNYGGRFYSDLVEEILSGGVSLSIPYTLFRSKGTVKAGAFGQVKNRDFSARVLGMVINDFFKFDWNLIKLSEDSIFAPQNISAKGFRIDEITNKSDKYDAGAVLYAGYLLSDNYFLPRLRAIWGIRYELYNQHLHSYDYGNKEINTDTTFRDILPSLNLVFHISEKTNLRGAVSRTLSRPEFRELAPFSFYDFNTSTAMIGNPGLERGIIMNYDLRFETYPGNAQLFAVTGFYKEFTNPIEQVLAFGGAGTRTLTFANVPKAWNYGIEIEFRKNLECFKKIVKWSQFENFTLFTNAAFIRSEVDVSEIASADSSSRPLQGQSPYLINAGLQYAFQKQGLHITLLYNRIGRRITEVGSVGYLDVYENDRAIVDFQISKKIFKNGDVKLNISDMLHQDAVFYQDQNRNKKYNEAGDTRITGIKNGTSYSLAFSYRF